MNNNLSSAIDIIFEINFALSEEEMVDVLVVLDFTQIPAIEA
jgi:hypothetical protein